ncbi:uncharacterized protein DFL_006087 [Arthrobotrys flagrans]|uniref:Uncharacterized protein n=1 Tax=Arthrobotrys flagrans TaxID=97331 RepID=A0A436ZZY5_ARTFL|nr:hypothetical protein DFL_006087 [Arthrobotrys flagrans]
MSRNLSDDEDMISSPSSPATPVNATAAPHLPAHLDLKTPPQSQDNTPYASRIAPTSFPAPTSASTATLQTSASTASATFHDLENREMTGGSSSAAAGPATVAVGNAGGSASGSSVATGGRRRQSQMTLSGSQGGNGVSIMQSTEAGVPMWLTKRGTEEVHNVEERLLDRGFSTHMYASIFNEKDMSLR